MRTSAEECLEALAWGTRWESMSAPFFSGIEEAYGRYRQAVNYGRR